MFFALVTTLLLGLMTIIDPCTLFLSIAAIGYIDQDVLDRGLVVRKGIAFALGKLLAYTTLAVPFLWGVMTIEPIETFLETYGEPFLAGFMIACGIVLLFVAPRHHHHHLHTTHYKGAWGAFGLGVVLALVICPHALIYFITMINMSFESPMPWLLPILFGLGSGVPIMVLAWLIAFGATSLGTMTHQLEVFEKWFRYICGILFIGAGMFMLIHHSIEN